MTLTNAYDTHAFHMVSTAADLAELTEQTRQPSIEVLGPATCPECKRTLDQFAKKNIPATKITMEPGDANYRMVTEDLELQAAPVVVVRIPEDPTAPILYWSRHRPDLVLRLSRLWPQLD